MHSRFPKRCAGWLLLLVLLGSGLLGSGISTLAPGQADTDPVKNLVDRCIAADGGEAGYRLLADTRAEYTARTQHENPGLRVDYRWTVIKRADGAMRIENEFKPSVEISGTDGKDFWWKPMRSKEAIDAPAPMVEAMRVEGILLNFFLRYEKLGYRGHVHPREATRITFRKKGAAPGSKKPGDEIDFVFDAGHHGIAELSMMVPDRDGGKPYRSSIRFQDFKKVRGVPVAHKLIVSRGKKVTTEATLVKIEIGAKLADSLFKRP